MRSTLYRCVLVLLDGTARSERGLGWVRRLALGTGSVVHLLMVTKPGRTVRDGDHVLAFVDQVEDAARGSAQVYLDCVASDLREDGLVVETHV
jgi:hypothetical protein